MTWLLAVWISLGLVLACQATLYQTIQQHHVARPGRTDILTLGKSRLLAATVPDAGTRALGPIGCVVLCCCCVVLCCAMRLWVRGCAQEVD
ncbi:hypothetical protein NHX12_030775 [Muraenolepis orangiensis]|uniref:Uncharacterized protein n=1 Tax=Muraenolepis orangiensis TaxID=630683 RepID=A0A9Q0EBZ7_9TELE|nr:hypothetical protein NHX12_030775 [Muraenolepis orangiensis]